MGAAAYYTPPDAGYAEEPCNAARQMLVQVNFNGPATPFGLRVRTYPEVTNLDELPPPVEDSTRDSWERPVALQGAGTPIIGGASFESAPELAPGTTYSDTLRPREQLIYKVKVGFGQSPRMTARLESDVVATRLLSILGVQVQSQTFNALGTDLDLTFNSATGASPNGTLHRGEAGHPDPGAPTGALPQRRVVRLGHQPERARRLLLLHHRDGR